MNDRCPNCSGVLQLNRAHAGKPATWLCAWCGRAGGYVRVKVGSRVVTVRDVVHEGDPALRRDWVPAESVPYAERVS